MTSNNLQSKMDFHADAKSQTIENINAFIE